MMTIICAYETIMTTVSYGIMVQHITENEED